MVWNVCSGESARRDVGRTARRLAGVLCVLSVMGSTPGCAGGAEEPAEPTCGASDELAITGDLTTSVATLTFNAANVTTTHKLDIDAAEDGCLTEITVLLWVAVGDVGGCVLQVTTGDALLAGSSLSVQSVALTADSFCPGFGDAVEGVYTAASTLVGTITPTESSVPGTVLSRRNASPPSSASVTT